MMDTLQRQITVVFKIAQPTWGKKEPTMPETLTLQPKPGPEWNGMEKRQAHIEATIALCKKCNNELETLGGASGRCVVTKQKKNLSLYLENLNVEDIPEKIEPEMVFYSLVRYGWVLDTPILCSEDVLTKFLRVFCQVSAIMLNLENFETQENSLALPAARILLLKQPGPPLRKLTPSFLEWFCACVDMNYCGDMTVLELGWCSTTTSKYTYNLQIRHLAGLALISLPTPTLEGMDYNPPSESSPIVS
ncbi:hypothetical protein NEDG_00908 [Nematocida displodere]|uniref:Uncharacterized protein n=1 Tax=Nematocida displodere TaxID=1805483 RepID=A0A177ECV5_9MICR|nr:hypothetical protein NEDG_00908 [Nematocida displodere]